MTQPSTSGDNAKPPTTVAIALSTSGRDEDAPEPAARPDDQQHAGNRRQRVLGELQDAAAIEPARLPERVQRQQRRQQHRHERAAGEHQPPLHRPIRHRRLHQRGEEHQDDRREDRQQRDAERGDPRGRGVAVANCPASVPTATFIRAPAIRPTSRTRDDGDREGTISE